MIAIRSMYNLRLYFKVFSVSLFSLLFVISCSKSSRLIDVECGYIPVSHGAKLYYEVAGEGESIILVHGHSLDSRMWDEQFPVFAQKYRVVRYDCRGYGRSSDQTEEHQFLHVEDLVTLMDSLHIANAHIVGLSMGGFITADMLVYAPERMRSAVLANGHFRRSPGPSEPLTEEEVSKRDKAISAVLAEGLDTYKQRWFQSLMASGGSQVERMREPLWTMISDWSGWQATHKEVRLLLGNDGIRMLEELHPDVPTLVLRGEPSADVKVKRPGFMSNLPNSRFEVIYDAGHMVNMERPETFNEHLMQFWDSLSTY